MYMYMYMYIYMYHHYTMWVSIHCLLLCYSVFPHKRMHLRKLVQRKEKSTGYTLHNLLIEIKVHSHIVIMHVVSLDGTCTCIYMYTCTHVHVYTCTCKWLISPPTCQMFFMLLCIHVLSFVFKSGSQIFKLCQSLYIITMCCTYSLHTYCFFRGFIT